MTNLLRRRKSRLAICLRIIFLLTIPSLYLLGKQIAIGNETRENFQKDHSKHLTRKLMSIKENATFLNNGLEQEEIIDYFNPNNSYSFNYDILNETTMNGLSEIYGDLNYYLQDDVNLLARKSENCTPATIFEFPSDGLTREQRRHGWIAFHVIMACYCFWLLAIVCDDYFVPAIDLMCNMMNMKKDIAGATFMAAASSSSELFINCVGTFITEGDIGIGTIVGSAVFNILAVPACCGLFAGQVVLLDWWPVSRDCLMYGFAVVALIITLWDGKVMWYEALGLVLAYIIYIIAMYCNDFMARRMRTLVYACKQSGRKPFKEVTEVSPLLSRDMKQLEDDIIKNSYSQLRNGVVDELPQTTNVDIESCSLQSDGSSESEAVAGPWNRREDSIFIFVCRWPIVLLLWLTIPDCKKHPKLRFLTFVNCVLWIGATSYIVAFIITIIGDTINIPDSVMGLTFLAAGTSVPEAVSSVIVTNQGHGTMGISNSIGSNTFDILLCLGFPWLIKSFFMPTEPGKYWITLKSTGMTYSAISLLSTLLCLYVAFVLNKFKLDWKIGLVCTLMYAGFLTFASMVELNFFFPVNLPTCSH